MTIVYRCLALVLATAMLLVACSAPADPLVCEYDLSGSAYRHSGENTDVAVDNTKPFAESDAYAVDIHTFMQTIAKSGSVYNSTVKEIAYDLGIDCLRKADNGVLYSVHTVTQGGRLYLFYTTAFEDEHAPVADAALQAWYYVRQPLEYADFADVLSREDAALRDVIAVDPTAQVFQNRLSSLEEHPEIFETKHYLTDGILHLYYRVDGENTILYDSSFVPDHVITVTEEAVGHDFHPITARIMDEDWV